MRNNVVPDLLDMSNSLRKLSEFLAMAKKDEAADCQENSGIGTRRWDLEWLLQNKSSQLKLKLDASNTCRLVGVANHGRFLYSAAQHSFESIPSTPELKHVG